MTATRIASVLGRRVWDSRGRPTVEAEVLLEGGARGRAIAPAGASRGTREAVDLRDGGKAFGGFGVQRAVDAVGGEIAAALAGRDVMDQAALDACLIALDGTPTRSRLGGNALIAVSMAAAHAAANACELPLWRHLSQGRVVRMPLPEIQIFGGGAHAGRRVDVQDFMVMPTGAHSFDEAMAMTAEVYRAAGELMQAAGKSGGVADEGGWWPDFASNEEALGVLTQAIERAGYQPGEQVAISLDIAASEFGVRQPDGSVRYRLGLEGRELDAGQWINELVGWMDRYPILSIEDPLSEHDDAGMAAFTALAGARVQVIGDDYLVTSAQRVREAAASGSCNAVLIKPNQAGTLTETRAALDAGRAAGFGCIVSARSGETEDVTIAHLAVGWDAGQFKVGSFARSERMAKWNEMLRIEAELGPSARYAGRAALPAGVLTWKKHA